MNKGTRMLKRSPTAFSPQENPQRSPEATPPVLFRLRPCWMTFLSILTMKQMEKVKLRTTEMVNCEFLILHCEANA